MAGRLVPVSKADDLVMPSWYQIGIPATRRQSDPVSPLAMYASSRIMIENAASALGRNLNRRQKKAVGRNAYQIAGGRGMLYAPLGMIG